MRSRAGKPDSLPDQPRAALEKPTTDALNVEKPKHENAGTVVTLLATPCFRPPTVEATWVPCPLHPEVVGGEDAVDSLARVALGVLADLRGGRRLR